MTCPSNDIVVVTNEAVTLHAGENYIPLSWIEPQPELMEDGGVYSAITEFGEELTLQLLDDTYFVCTQEDVFIAEGVCITIFDPVKEEDDCVEGPDLVEECGPCEIEVTYNNKRVDPCQT